MAVIYQKRLKQTLYEVRTAGQSVRLYSNGVLHSQYNPNAPINGAIWDLLLLPAFLLTAPPKSVLLLGLGGGTLVHTLKRFFPDCHITCLELDVQHIHIAKRYFKIPQEQVTVINGDAYAYLGRTGKRFDLIVDDVFQHVKGEPERTIQPPEATQYQQHLTMNGVLAMNIIDDEPYGAIEKIRRDFKCCFEFQHPLYENRIFAFLNTKEDVAGLYERLGQFTELRQSRKTCRLNFQLVEHSS